MLCLPNGGQAGKLPTDHWVNTHKDATHSSFTSFQSVECLKRTPSPGMDWQPKPGEQTAAAQLQSAEASFG